MGVMTEKFSNAQLEIVQMFATEWPEPAIKALKKILLRFKAEQLMDQADEIWAEKNWTNEDVKRLLQIKMRTPYKRRNRA